MCLLALVYHLNPNAPLMVLANREEAWCRPSRGPSHNLLEDNRLRFQAGPTSALNQAGGAPAPARYWFGGVDLVGGGTWLGINRHGLLSAITNRPQATIPQQPVSRGLLCASAMACPSAALAAEQSRALLARRLFAGCNLLLADCHQAFLVESGDEVRFHQLGAGTHLITNMGLGHPADQRACRAGRLLEEVPAAAIDAWLPAAAEISAQHGTGEEPAICLHGAAGGTVSASLIAVGPRAESCRYWYADGPPCTAKFSDLSPRFRAFLQHNRPDGSARKDVPRESAARDNVPRGAVPK